MALGGQMHHRIRLMFAEDRLQSDAITNVDLLKPVAVVFDYTGQRLQVASIGKLIQVDHAVFGVIDQKTNYCGPDESRSAGNEDFHSHP
mgnify:CR=1 FL=1